MDPFLKRCLLISATAHSAVEPNPRVGAVVVENGTILGEAFHREYGQAHAEPQALQQAYQRSSGDLSGASLYIGLEPCNHHGKTPPCTEQILHYGIRHVVVGSQDPNPKMRGTSLAYLREQGVQVELAADPTPFHWLNRHFLVNQQSGRPYLHLKWAQTQNGIIGNDAGPRLNITGGEANRLVHQYRANHHAIMVGRKTVEHDDPLLSTRNFPGPSPIRLILDPDLKLGADYQLFRSSGKAVVINRHHNEEQRNLTYFRPAQDEAFKNLGLLFREIYARLGIGSILVEGGRTLLQALLDQELWDEVSVFTSKQWKSGNIGAPSLSKNYLPNTTCQIGKDTLAHFLGESYK
jgi:diaminohydroxyphosphoribosylaminopyrimidine deaminase/5-amino-6-(5-phosphoribosylamino)uracil reductase